MEENKKDIVGRLSILMKATRAGYDMDKLVLSEDSGEVIVRYVSGYYKWVTVVCVSGAALLRVVVNSLISAEGGGSQGWDERRATWGHFINLPRQQE